MHLVCTACLRGCMLQAQHPLRSRLLAPVPVETRRTRADTIWSTVAPKLYLSVADRSKPPAQSEKGDGYARLVMALLVLLGLLLIGAGSLLWSHHGDTVILGNPILAALAWCFSVAP